MILLFWVKWVNSKGKICITNRILIFLETDEILRLKYPDQ